MLGYGMLAGLTVATGAILLGFGLRRPNPRLADAIGALTGDTAQSNPTIYLDDPTGWEARLGAWTEHNLAGRLGLHTPTTDLLLIQRSRTWYWTEKSTGALGGLIAPSIIAALNAALGSPIPLLIPLAAAIALAAYLWIAPDAKVRAQATAARTDFNEAAVAYFQSMALLRAAGAGGQTAMTEAASTSDAWMFVRIREEISRADLTGTPAHDGVSNLGARTGIEALQSAGDIMRLATQEGASAAESLLAAARDKRAHLLGEELNRAQARTTQMNAPIGVLVTLGFFAIAAPFVAQLFSP